VSSEQQQAAGGKAQVSGSKPAAQGSQPTASVDWSSLLVLGWGGLYVAALELVAFVTHGGAPPLDTIYLWQYGLGLLLFAGGGFLINSAPVAAAGLLAERLRFVSTEWLWPLAAAVFGYFWQETVAMGDGLRAHEHYLVIRVCMGVGGPLGLALFVWLVMGWDGFPGWFRRAVAAVALAAGTYFNLFILSAYREFHGFLAMWNGMLFCWLFYPWLKDWVLKAEGALIIALMATGAALINPIWTDVQLSIQGFGHLSSAVLTSMPVTALAEIEPEDPMTHLSAESQEEGHTALGARFRAETRGDFSRQKARHVLLIVLEATRWDAWGDPELTPRFHGWKERGVYFPNGVAQYPATPLAYGALFTSQTPFVLSQSPHWGKHRLFDHLADRFDHFIASQPAVKWFDTTAITQYFIPKGVKAHRHRSASSALAHIRKNLRDLPEGETFFAWTHLYEPHVPYRTHRGHNFGKSKVSRYRSEVAYLDDELGKFMKWFYKQPFAEDTLVIVLGDHGEALGEEVFGRPFSEHHVHVHNLVSRVPVFAAGPGLPKDVVRDKLAVGQLDLMPTLFDGLGVTPPEELYVQGYSIYYLLRNRVVRDLPTEAFSIRGPKFFKFVANAHKKNRATLKKKFKELTSEGKKYTPKIALQRGRYKIIYDRTLRRAWVYDIQDDPYEQRDLAGSDPELLDKMKMALDSWHARQGWIIEQLEPLLDQ